MIQTPDRRRVVSEPKGVSKLPGAVPSFNVVNNCEAATTPRYSTVPLTSKGSPNACRMYFSCLSVKLLSSCVLM